MGYLWSKLQRIALNEITKSWCSFGAESEVGGMGRDDVIRQLKVNLNRFSEFKIKSLAIFGSVARDEAKPNSDVDILVEFEGPATFDLYMELKLFLEDLLGRPVDLVTRKGVRPELAPYVEQEARRVA